MNHPPDCPCVLCDPMQVRLGQQMRAMREGEEWRERAERAEAEVERLRGLMRHDQDYAVNREVVWAIEKERDEARDALKLLRDAVNDSGPCTDDNHGDTCACNADVMIANLGAHLRALAEAGDRLASQCHWPPLVDAWREAKAKGGELILAAAKEE